jgi:hypothetical protein
MGKLENVVLRCLGLFMGVFVLVDAQASRSNCTSDVQQLLSKSGALPAPEVVHGQTIEVDIDENDFEALGRVAALLQSSMSIENGQRVSILSGPVKGNVLAVVGDGHVLVNTDLNTTERVPEAAIGLAIDIIGPLHREAQVLLKDGRVRIIDELFTDGTMVVRDGNSHFGFNQARYESMRIADIRGRSLIEAEGVALGSELSTKPGWIVKKIFSSREVLIQNQHGGETSLVCLLKQGCS